MLDFYTAYLFGKRKSQEIIASGKIPNLNPQLAYDAKEIVNKPFWTSFIYGITIYLYIIFLPILTVIFVLLHKYAYTFFNPQIQSSINFSILGGISTSIFLSFIAVNIFLNFLLKKSKSFKYYFAIFEIERINNLAYSTTNVPFRRLLNTKDVENYYAKNRNKNKKYFYLSFLLAIAIAVFFFGSFEYFDEKNIVIYDNYAKKEFKTDDIKKVNINLKIDEREDDKRYWLEIDKSVKLINDGFDRGYYDICKIDCNLNNKETEKFINNLKKSGSIFSCNKLKQYELEWMKKEDLNAINLYSLCDNYSN